MNICLVISSLNPGGAERVISQLGNFWARNKNNHVTIITFSSPKDAPFYSLDANINLEQLDVAHAGYNPFVRLANNFTRLYKIRKTIQTCKPDVIISFIDILNIAVLISTIGLKIPVIISERIDPHFYIIPKIYQKLRKKLYPLCHKLVVQTQSAANFFPEYYKQFIEIIPNPVPEPPLRKEDHIEKPTHLISTGRLNSQKDHTTLIRAFSKLKQLHPNLKLSICGEGQEREKLEALIKELGLSDSISLPGTTPHIYEALSKSDIFIFPSKYEGFPNALCEAMAVGLPVIASRCSGNVDIVQDKVNGRLFSIGDVEELTNVCHELILDNQERRKLSQAARNICSTYHPERLLEQWDHLAKNSFT